MSKPSDCITLFFESGRLSARLTDPGIICPINGLPGFFSFLHLIPWPACFLAPESEKWKWKKEKGSWMLKACTVRRMFNNNNNNNKKDDFVWYEMTPSPSYLDEHDLHGNPHAHSVNKQVEFLPVIQSVYSDLVCTIIRIGRLVTGTCTCTCTCTCKQVIYLSHSSWADFP